MAKDRTHLNNIFILGISCFYHDSAAVLIKDGQLVAAVQEERFTRKKHDDSFPEQAVNYCLKKAGIVAGDLACVCFYDKPLLKFERIVESFIRSWPNDFKMFLSAMPIWLKEKLWIKKLIRKKLNFNGPIYFSEHHMSHAASAFFVSPFEEAAILTIDGVGEWATTAFGLGRDNKINIIKEINYPDSLGLFYSFFTHYLGFKPNSGEYKVMGLAPYGLPAQAGQPIYEDKIRELIDIFPDGSFKLNRSVFKSFYGMGDIEAKFESIFGRPKRLPRDKLDQFHKDLAASIQKVTNDVVATMVNYVHKETGADSLCLAGGVALNCVANSGILKNTPFKKVFIQPAAGDAGGALGAAYFIWHQVFENKRSFVMEHASWGPEFSNEEIKELLDKKGVEYKFLDYDQLLKTTADLIDKQNVIGWFQGQMEWGPRALGNRSILADPRNKENWQRVNLKIKFRESFRPFAPSVMEEYASDFFDLPFPSPYMLFVAEVKTDNIPAVTHVDKTARLQTVNSRLSPLYHGLLEEFRKLTGCPVLINTSFNVRGEPIVCTPADAFNTFIKTDIDYLVLGNFILDKKETLKKYPFVPPQISPDAD